MSVLDMVADPTGEFPADVPEYFFYLMFMANRHRDLAFDAALAPIGLTLNQWRSLSVIRRRPSCTMKDLARYTTIDRTTLTRSVDTLVEQGTVVRSTPAGDRRKVELNLTDQGVAAYRGAVAILTSFNGRALDGVGVADQRAIVRSMKTIVGNLVTDPRLREELIVFDSVPAEDAEAAY